MSEKQRQDHVQLLHLGTAVRKALGGGVCGGGRKHRFLGSATEAEPTHPPPTQSCTVHILFFPLLHSLDLLLYCLEQIPASVRASVFASIKWTRMWFAEFPGLLEEPNVSNTGGHPVTVTSRKRTIPS